MKTFIKSTNYTVYLLVTLVAAIVISSLLVKPVAESSGATAQQTMIGMFAFAFIYLAYILVEMRSSIKIDEHSIVDKKMYGSKRFEFKEIRKIEYRKSLMKLNSMVLVHSNSGRIIRLNYWYKDFPELVRLLCKNTQSVSDQVKLSDQLRRDFGL